MVVRLFDRICPLLFLLAWSSGAIVVKLGIQDASVWSFLALRSAGAFVLFSVACRMRLGSFGPALLSGVSGPLIGKVVLCGIAMQIAYQSFFFLSLDAGLSPGILAIVLGLQPMLMPVIAREKLGVFRYFILLAGFAGLVMVVLASMEVQIVPAAGLAFAGISVLAMGVGTTLQSRIDVSPLVSAWLHSAIAGAVFVAVASIDGWRFEATGEFVACLVWMTAVVSVGATLLLFHLLSVGKAAGVGVLFYLVPIVTLALDVLIFDVEISDLVLMGCSVVAVSVYLFRRLDFPGRENSSKT